MLIRSALVLALLASLSVAPAGAAPGEPRPSGRALSTPDLLERAVERGRLNRATADLYLARALGDHRTLPDRFVSDVPWDGTLPLLHLRQRVKRMSPGPQRSAISALTGPGICHDSVSPLLNSTESLHFYVEYQIIAAPLTIDDYKTSLDASWTKEVTEFGWAAPPIAPVPAPGNKYYVRIDALASGLYGFVSNVGTHAGLVGDNSNTTGWNEGDAYASCMVLNRDYNAFPSPPQASLDATTAHEFNHSIQFGYGALTGPNAADDVFVEGGATWMEDEVFDDANDNYFYLWPDFTQSMGAYTGDPYGYFVVFRTLTERFGTGTANAGEQVMQDFWEETSKSLTSNQFRALSEGLGNKGTNLPDAFHAAAIAVRLGQACGGVWAYPYCLEENPAYAMVAGPLQDHGSIATAGGTFPGSIRDDYSINWVALPASGPYPVTLISTSQEGSLRATVACVTGAGPKIAPFPAVVGAGAATTLPSFDPAGCTGPPVAVITNQSETSANPSVSASRSYELFLGLLAKTVKLKAKPRTVDRGDRTSLRAKVLPCDGHEGDRVQFFRKKKRIATKKSNKACVAKVKVKVPRTSVFRAVSPQQDDDHLKGTSSKVKVRVRQA
ncbi:MAG: hypothetical protein ACRDIZ_06905 [Actinomycetota bacterium]